ncbi:DUF3298 and DUF4163 domain-containing protein [Clostridium botulinum C]|uniref:DUF3298 and DUF4163 domain-containing protein n=2 Tax=Clostridium botulinum TaxID=1491 RepID=A0A9Q4TL48_CLOBO|nr:DUF3298 and DUF4163 domain-containing protein [Clostridium botulinum]MCD3195531.1 DUF3298 and DUF4163 domain-containing protein [Clostridium botulinum C]MCD3200947.1 DUF3298 and DUF4163 domain-containing protein [Clostridium botulinum C]MCD3206296.1 DUF3298 and DUF4163 domain-containing protein [Clostridium botulinum C]MCD3208930.1 DUF3298 and DUF4163 domain-containing protein [Clostridium botulinum C]MCD3226024.1 DUF3298 and DUF4163 domain-containing protein [Clostridium botulinum C]
MNNFIYISLIISLLSSSTACFNTFNNTTKYNLTELTSNIFKNKVKIITKELEIKKDYFDSKLKFPIIIGLKDENIEKQVNSVIENDVLKFRNKIKDLAKKNKEKSIKEGYELLPYVAYTDYKVSTIKDDFVSFYIDFYELTGGAHGSTLRKSYNIDLKTGKLLTLNDILKDIPNYKDIINKYIYNEISKKPDIYFVDSFKGITDNIAFTIEKDALVIYFQQYEIAPYSSGIPEFRIPFIKLSSF